MRRQRLAALLGAAMLSGCGVPIPDLLGRPSLATMSAKDGVLGPATDSQPASGPLTGSITSEALPGAPPAGMLPPTAPTTPTAPTGSTTPTAATVPTAGTGPAETGPTRPQFRVPYKYLAYVNRLRNLILTGSKPLADAWAEVVALAQRDGHSLEAMTQEIRALNPALPPDIGKYLAETADVEIKPVSADEPPPPVAPAPSEPGGIGPGGGTGAP